MRSPSLPASTISSRSERTMRRTRRALRSAGSSTASNERLRLRCRNRPRGLMARPSIPSVAARLQARRDAGARSDARAAQPALQRGALLGREAQELDAAAGLQHAVVQDDAARPGDAAERLEGLPVGKLELEQHAAARRERIRGAEARAARGDVRALLAGGAEERRAAAVAFGIDAREPHRELG